MAVDLKTVSSTLVSGLVSDSALDTFRKATRGDSQPGKTDRLVFPPRFSNGRFEIQNTDCPYLSVMSKRGELLGHTGESHRTELAWNRQILGLWSKQNPTYESDAGVKEFFELTLRAVHGDAMLASLQALGVRHIETDQFFVDGLNSGDQAFFSMDVSIFFAGEALA